MQGHKRASSDVSVASSEDEKIPLSPSILESVPEKAEATQSAPAAPETPETPETPEPHTPISTSFVEEAVTPASEESTEGSPITPVKEEMGQQRTAEQEIPGAKEEVSSTKVEVPDKEMQQLEINAEDEKEGDTAEVPADTPPSVEGSEVTVRTLVAVEESGTPEEEQYKHLKVTLTLPEERDIPKEESREKPTDKDQIMSVDDKQVSDKAKDEKERDSDSGRGSVSESNSVDLNLSISSFLSKAKEPASVSVQVTQSLSISHYTPVMMLLCLCIHHALCFSRTRSVRGRR